MLQKKTKSAVIVAAATAVVGGALFLGFRSGDSTASNTAGEIHRDVQTQTPIAEAQRPQIDVVFALDTTGSMSGMIAGAKRKIWSLANEISSGQPRPIVRFGLVGYRDIGDAYVTKVTGLSTDMDAMYDELMAFTADGGGDGPEHVNQALADSLDKMEWKQGPKVLRLVFLVGDAPPHNDYEDGLNSEALARRAQEKGIIINAIRTGTDTATGDAWQKIASLGGGQYHSIAQSGGMVAVATPYDAKLAELNRSLADSTIAYGSASSRGKMRAKVANRMAMKAEVAASAASYSAKTPSAGLGSGDLFEELESGRVSLDALDDSNMGAALNAMSSDERKGYIASKKKSREKAQKELKQIAKERDEWVKKNVKKDEASMDSRMMGSVKEQAADMGVAWE
jgi:Mg-chelatase subunit ChlD